MKNTLKNWVVTPISKFVQIESFGGILLFIATIVALIWANSPLAESYHAIWHYEVGFEFGNFKLSKTLIHWINDGLMAVFFFVIGLEIKREILMGELNTIRKASLPIFAALGGVFVPIGIFMFLNKDPETFRGWGIPMATDIAFSLAVLQILGNRVPLALKIFLTAFAIVDDLVAVLAIAIFYSSSIDWMLILYSLVPLTIMFILSRRQYFSKFIYAILGCSVWFLFLKSGIHPTISGVIVALSIPIHQKMELASNIYQLEGIANKLFKISKGSSPILSRKQIYLIDDIQEWTSKVQSPLQYSEHVLHGWVAYFIIPLFALANAGISFSSDAELNLDLAWHIAIALIVGKCIGVVSFSYLGLKLRLADLPGNIKFPHLLGTGFLAGIGFTMSIFVTNLAFENSAIFADSSKVGILAGSFIAGLIGYIILRLSKPVEDE
ncbi:Na+/H+ antiporter NhaA [Formosa sp. S-31]|uniref:Na+/H+ antiporter NhaA n=1 Tax=Formosa sp. S-31 TaxID=2790949 RepID=UPI003EB82C80